MKDAKRDHEPDVTSEDDVKVKGQASGQTSEPYVKVQQEERLHLQPLEGCSQEEHGEEGKRSVSHESYGVLLLQLEAQLGQEEQSDQACSLPVSGPFFYTPEQQP